MKMLLDAHKDPRILTRDKWIPSYDVRVMPV